MNIEPVKSPSNLVEWNGIKFYIENVDGNINVLFDNDIHIGVNGEFGVVTTNNMHFDTIKSKLFLNSRKSKALKDMPESKEYRQNLDLEQKSKLLLIDNEHEHFINKMEDLDSKVEKYINTIELLGKKIEELEQKLKECI